MNFSRSSTNPSFLYGKLQRDLHYFGRNNSELMNFVTLVNIFNCYGSILSKFPTNEKRKNCFLAACKIWHRYINLDEIDEKFPHGGRIGYKNSLLDFVSARSKIFRLHSILHESAGALKTTTDEGPGYCYMLLSSMSYNWIILLSLHQSLSSSYF